MQLSICPVLILPTMETAGSTLDHFSLLNHNMPIVHAVHSFPGNLHLNVIFQNEECSFCDFGSMSSLKFSAVY